MILGWSFKNQPKIQLSVLPQRGTIIETWIIDMEDKKKKYQNTFIFEYLKNILTDKSIDIYNRHVNDKENFKSCPSVVIMRYLSMCPDRRVRDLITENQVYLERLDKISHRFFYMWCIDNIPQQKSSFIKYIK